MKVTGYGTGAGLGGWNCSHSFRPWFEGMSRTYSKEMLEDYNAKKFEYNGKKLTEYEALQEERKLERNIRRWKREQNALQAAGLDTSEATAKVRKWNGKHKDFLEQTGLKADGTRTMVGKGILRNKTIFEVDKDEMQNYRPIIHSDESYSESRGNIKIQMKKVENSSYKGNIFISETVTLKPKQFHRIELSLNKALDIVKQNGTGPDCIIVTSKEMQTSALCSYNATKNTLFIDSVVADLESLIELQKDMVCPDNPLSTYVHEMLHWMDADNYRKTEDIVNQLDYLESLRRKHKKNIDNLIREGYNIIEVSKYAKEAYYRHMFDETWTEYRVWKLLGRGE